MSYIPEHVTHEIHCPLNPLYSPLFTPPQQYQHAGTGHSERQRQCICTAQRVVAFTAPVLVANQTSGLPAHFIPYAIPATGYVAPTQSYMPNPYNQHSRPPLPDHNDHRRRSLSEFGSQGRPATPFPERKDSNRNVELVRRRSAFVETSERRANAPSPDRPPIRSSVLPSVPPPTQVARASTQLGSRYIQPMYARPEEKR